MLRHQPLAIGLTSQAIDRRQIRQRAGFENVGAETAPFQGQAIVHQLHRNTLESPVRGCPMDALMYALQQ